MGILKDIVPAQASQNELNMFSNHDSFPFFSCLRIYAMQMFYKLLRSAGLDPGQDMLAGLEAGREAIGSRYR